MNDRRRLAAAVAAADLTGRPAHPLPPDGDADLLHAARAHGLAGLLDAHVAAARVAGEDTWSARVEEAARLEATRCVSLDLAAAEASVRLAAADVPHRLLKGAAVAHLDEARPVQRSYSDVDLLVGAERLPTAVDVLRTLGFERDLPERRAGFDRVSKDVTLLGEVASIDLHRALVLGPFGGTIGQAGSLWAAADVVRLAGVDVPTLDAEGRFVHACATAVLADPEPKLTALRDVALLSHRPLDLARVDALAPRGRGAAVVAAAVERCRAELGEVVGDAGLTAAGAGAPAARWERLAMRAYRGTGGSNTTELLGVAAGLPGWRDRATYLAGLVLPSPAYRAARRGQGRPAEWRSGLRDLVGRNRRHHLG